jgi:hypothetical protein
VNRAQGPETRAHLIHLLVEAAEIEHNLLCSYLYAAFSLKTAGEGLSTEEAAVVDGWRKTIIGVAVEEMGHLALVNNLLVAVGGNAHFNRPNLPVPPGYHPAGFVIRLTPFSKATLDHFIFLERPLSSPIQEGAGFEDEHGVARTPTSGHLTPSTPDYETIGEFYGDIEAHITALVDRLGEGVLFAPAGLDRQLGPVDVTLPGLRLIRSAEDAALAVQTIVEQGEGAPAETEDCHFVRFREILAEWEALEAANPAFAPAHPAAEDPVMRRPADDLDRVWITHAPSAALLDLGNATYALMMALLAQAYGPGIGADDRKAYVSAALALMHGISDAGSALARLPSGQSSSNAGLTFAVPRSTGALSPAMAARLLSERLGDLVAGAARVTGTPAGLVSALHDAGAKMPRADGMAS